MSRRDVRERAADSGEGRVPDYKDADAYCSGCISTDLKARPMERRGPSESQQTNLSMCEPTQRSCEPRRKRMDERSASSEMARIITDPITGKCYCRGKVLGKVA